MLYGWDDKRFDQEYWEQLKRNQRHQKGIQGRRTLETIQKEEDEQGIEGPRIEEWDKKDKMGNLQDLYNKL